MSNGVTVIAGSNGATVSIAGLGGTGGGGSFLPDIYDVSGLVGINKPTPSFNLDVYNPFSSFSIVGNGSGSIWFTSLLSGGESDIWVGPYPVWGNHGNVILQPLGTGLVGINVLTPQYELDINGIMGNSQTRDYLLNIGTNNSYINANGGSVGINTTSPMYTLDVHGNIGNSFGTLSIQAGNDEIILVTPDSALYFQLDGTSNNIDTEGSVLSFNGNGNGNVGIGTTSPRLPMDVNGKVIMGLGGSTTDELSNINSALVLSISVDGDVAPSLTILNAGNGGAGAGSAIDFYNYGFQYSVYPGGRIYTLDDGNYGTHFVFATKQDGGSNNGLVDRMYINGNNGYIGINTDNVNYQLDVNGVIGNSNGALTLAGNSNSITLATANGTFFVNGNGGNGNIDLTANNGSITISNATSYGLGVGQTNPQFTLDVNGNIGNSAGNLLFVNSNGNDIQYFISSGRYLKVQDGSLSTPIFYIYNNSGGAVGIRNSLPKYQLDVSGTGNFTKGIMISSGLAPATSSSVGTVGQVAWDTGFLYICTNTNTWKRVGLSSF